MSKCDKCDRTIKTSYGKGAVTWNSYNAKCEQISHLEQVILDLSEGLDDVLKITNLSPLIGEDIVKTLSKYQDIINKIKEQE